jgi:TonB family protein
MKRVGGIFLVFVFLAGTLLAAANDESGEGKRPTRIDELRWPEIRDSKPLISLAKTWTKHESPESISHPVIPGRNLEEIAYLEPYQMVVYPAWILIILDTHPFNGQAFLVSPGKSVDPTTYPAWLRSTQDTSMRQIKKALIRLSGESFKPLEGINGMYVRWSNLKKEVPETATAPYPVKMFAPGYPEDMAQAGLTGEVRLTFTVTVSGDVTAVESVARFPEFVRPAEEAIKLWKFEPGLDRDTLQSVETKVSVTAVFLEGRIPKHD